MYELVLSSCPSNGFVLSFWVLTHWVTARVGTGLGYFIIDCMPVLIVEREDVWRHKRERSGTGCVTQACLFLGMISCGPRDDVGAGCARKNVVRHLFVKGLVFNEFASPPPWICIPPPPPALTHVHSFYLCPDKFKVSAIDIECVQIILNTFCIQLAITVNSCPTRI